MQTIQSSDKTAAGGASWTEYPSLAWRGAGMGVAEVIPGVSGGTVALITGVLPRLLDAIHSFNISSIRMLLSLRLKEFMAATHWRFLVMLFSGQLLGVLLCTKVLALPRLLREHPEPMLGLFFGLILSSVILMMRDAGRPGWRGLLAYLGGGLAGAIVVAGVRADTPDAPWFIVIAGALAICAWILPGISGSFILLLLHKYDYIWEAVTFSNGLGAMHNVVYVIIPLGIGAVTGLMLFSRVLSWVMHRWTKLTMMAMNGLLLVSLYAIFPFQNAVYEVVASGKEKLVRAHPYIPSMEKLLSGQGLLTIGLGLGGAAVVFTLDYLARRKRTEASPSSAVSVTATE
ncbi:MAG: DUF368 domain-containing protein [Chitinivibrionales bacterium]|nr:DUF368 domain-containing protein [Chitinivibrionales bacterium]